MEGLEMNAYEVLCLDKGPESTDDEIKKAYRKRALQLHPDKNRAKPDAAADFGRLQVAYELLCDAGARENLDKLLRAQAARQARLSGASEKRRKLAAELERREQTWVRQDTEERELKAKLKAEIERLRQRHKMQGAQQRQEAAAAAAAASLRGHPGGAGSPAFFAGASPAQGVPGGAAATPPSGAVPAQAPPPAVSAERLEELTKTLKVSWDLRHGTYTAQRLRELFSHHGPVADVITRDSKKRNPRKGSALVVMATPQGAAAAAGAPHGDADNPLLVLPFSKVPSVEEAYRNGLGAGTPPTSPPPSPSRGTPPPPSWAAAAGATPASQPEQRQQEEGDPPPSTSTPAAAFPLASGPREPRSAPPLRPPPQQGARSFPLQGLSASPAAGTAGAAGGAPAAPRGPSRLGEGAAAGPRRSSFPGLEGLSAGRQAPSGPGRGPVPGSAPAAAAAGPAAAGFGDFESVAGMQARRRAERERLVRELEAEERAEAAC